MAAAAQWLQQVTDDRDVTGSNHIGAAWKLWRFPLPHLAGKETKSRWSHLYSVYVRGSKISLRNMANEMRMVTTYMSMALWANWMGLLEHRRNEEILEEEMVQEMKQKTSEQLSKSRWMESALGEDRSCGGGKTL